MSAGEDIRRLLRAGPIRRGEAQRRLPQYAKVTIWNNLTELQRLGLIVKTQSKPFFYRLPNIKT